MCFHSKQTKSAQELENRFKAKFKDSDLHKPNESINGFEHPKTPIIISANPTEIILAEWGFLPSWAKDTSFQRNTLNAKYETIKEKISFKDYTQNRCLILVDGFYEWKWLDGKGKVKEKYLITSKMSDQFAFAGLWNEWGNPISGEKKVTYTILTTKANELMSEIHNTKQRMPVILQTENEQKYLLRQKFDSNLIDLRAEKVN